MIQRKRKSGSLGYWTTLLGAILAIIGQARAGEMNFTVSPTVVTFEAMQGSVRKFDLFFLNQGEVSLEVTLQVMDFFLNPEGIPVLKSSARNRSSWTRFVSLNRATFTAKPDKPNQVHVTLKVPRGRRGGGYFAVVFNTRELQSVRKRVQGNVLALGGQLPILFLGEIRRTGKRSGQIPAAALNKGPYSPSHPLKMRFTLVNKGTIHYNARGKVLIRDRKRKIIDRIPLDGGRGLVLPGGQRYFRGIWSKAHDYFGQRLIADVRFHFSGGHVRRDFAITFRKKLNHSLSE